jgi:hypothetical protein
LRRRVNALGPAGNCVRSGGARLEKGNSSNWDMAQIRITKARKYESTKKAAEKCESRKRESTKARKRPEGGRHCANANYDIAKVRQHEKGNSSIWCAMPSSSGLLRAFVLSRFRDSHYSAVFFVPTRFRDSHFSAVFFVLSYFRAFVIRIFSAVFFVLSRVRDSHFLCCLFRAFVLSRFRDSHFQPGRSV